MRGSFFQKIYPIRLLVVPLFFKKKEKLPRRGRRYAGHFFSKNLPDSAPCGAAFLQKKEKLPRRGRRYAG
jgi:hypothetical protein